MPKTLCYSLISLEKLPKNKKENNHYVVNIKRSSLLHDGFKKCEISIWILKNTMITTNELSLTKYKMVHTCIFNYVALSLPTLKSFKCVGLTGRSSLQDNKGILSYLNPDSLWMTIRLMLIFVPSNDHSQHHV